MEWTSECIVHREVTRDPLAPSIVRSMVNEVVVGAGSEMAVLAASEIASNAVRHGSSSDPDVIEATVCRRGRTIRVEVVAPGRFRWRRNAGEPGGRGMDIVSRLATSWGLEQVGSQVRVWFTLDGVEPRTRE